MAADKYWLGRLKKDRALARRAADQVSAEVRKAYRSQYLQTAKNLERLYAEAQNKGTLSRTKLWNYRRWRDMEPKLRQFCEAQGVIQTEKITKALDRVFEDVIGAGVEAFQQDKFILPYDPRAVIDTAWSGEHYSARVWRNTGELAQRIQAEAQQVVMGDKSMGEVKRQLMHDFDVAWGQADRLVDTEVSYVMNRANLEQYKGYGFRKVEIVNLDVNTCEKCKALEGEVFSIIDAPVLPIHPRCHCSYCVPEGGDEAEVTASRGNLDEVYARKGVKGYNRVDAAGAKQYSPKGAKAVQAQPIPVSRLESKVNEALNGFEQPEVKLEKAAKANPQAPAAVSLPAAAEETATEAMKTPENTGVLDVSVLREAAESGIIKTEEIRARVDNQNTLPGANEAVIAQSKLKSYILNKDHPVGGPKAHLIDSVLGYSENDWEQLGEELQVGLATAKAEKVEETDYGVKYMVPIRVSGKKNKSMILFTVWQIDKGTNVARFITSTFDTKTIEGVIK